jgi:RNA polymerase sigma factor FliA
MSILPALGRSSLPPRITIVPSGRISILPRAPARPTLPPRVRAARMMATVRKLAAKLARRIPRHIDVEDLVGAGSLGLADALSRRGAMPGSEFEAFASYRIRGAMLDELRRLDAMPRRSRRSARHVATASRSVEQRLGRPAAEEDVAAELGLEMKAYQALRADLDANRAPLPFSALGGDEDAPHEVADSKQEAPDALAARAQMNAQIAAKIGALSERTRAVLLAIYVEGTTLKQIGQTLGVSESRVCQIHTEAIASLRSALHEEAAQTLGIEDPELGGHSGPSSQTRIKLARAQERAVSCRTKRAS